MLLSMHVTRVPFLVLAGNSALTMGFIWSYTLTLVARSYIYALLLVANVVTVIRMAKTLQA